MKLLYGIILKRPEPVDTFPPNREADWPVVQEQAVYRIACAPPFQAIHPTVEWVKVEAVERAIKDACTMVRNSLLTGENMAAAQDIAARLPWLSQYAEVTRDYKAVIVERSRIGNSLSCDDGWMLSLEHVGGGLLGVLGVTEEELAQAYKFSLYVMRHLIGGGGHD